MTNVKHLYDQFKPSTYDLSLIINPDKLVFSGKVTLTGELTKASQTISLHSKDLEIATAKIDGQIVNTSSHVQDELRLATSESLAKGKHEVEIEFNGKITETMHGVYFAKNTIDGREDTIVATQLESHHAREVFPCIDEPMAKAVFNLTLDVPKELQALANMPVKSNKTAGSNQVVEFESTPVMSTYLLAFVVGNYAKISGHTKRGVEVIVWATKDKIEHCQFALDVGIKGLDFYEDYFGIDYPLPKCDMLGVPNFSAGAMENWGLITYRESALLVDAKNTKLATKQRVAETIVHELAHQWFGNLVTMKWWNDLWLNEGFASWAANFTVDKLFPEWNYWAQFIAGDFTLVQSADAVPSSRPIETKINDPDEIRSLFDEISYSKGPVIVRMLHQFLGEEDFRQGITHYLNQYLYKNASTADLWQALEEKSGKPVAKFMSAWTSQAGFPVISLDVHANQAKLSQKRFMLTGKADDRIWPVPLSHSGSEENFLLDTKTATWDTDLSTCPKFNVGQAGLYMLSYPEDYLQELNQAVATGKLDEVDRLGLINDRFELARSGDGSIVDSIKLIEKLSKDESLVVWSVIASEISTIRRVMDDTQLIDNMRPFAKSLTDYNVERLGWEPKKDESNPDTMLRPLILGLAGFGDNKSVTDKALQMFTDANSPEDIAPDVRGVVYGLAVRFGDAGTFDKLLSFYSSTNSPQEKQALAGALTGFRQPEIIAKALELINTDVKLQDAGFWIAYSFANRYSKQQTWDWVKQNWSWILDKFGEDIMTLSWIPEYSAYAFATDEFLQDYQTFWKQNHQKSIERDINKGLEALGWQIAWRKRDLDDLKKYFKN